MDLLWEYVVEWGPDLAYPRCIELRASPFEGGSNEDRLASSPLPLLFQQAEPVYMAGTLRTPTFLHLPAVIYRLVQRSSNNMSTAARTSNLKPHPTHPPHARSFVTTLARWSCRAGFEAIETQVPSMEADDGLRAFAVTVSRRFISLGICV